MSHEVSDRFFVSFPETLVDRPIVYEMVQQFRVVPNIRRANVEEHTGWMILELTGGADELTRAVAWLRDTGCQVNRQEGDILEG